MDSHTQNAGFAEASKQIITVLDTLKQRGKKLALTAGVGWSLSVALLAFASLLFALGWWGGTWIRILGWILTLGAVITTGALTCLRPIKQIDAPHGVARRVGNLFPHMSSDVLSASQFATCEDPKFFSPVLIEGHLRSVQSRLQVIPPEKIFSVKILVPPAVLLGLTIALLTLFLYSNRAIATTGLNYLFVDPDIPGMTNEKNDALPVVSDLKLTLRFPAYLIREDRVLSGVSGGFRVPPGTEVGLEGRSLLPDAKEGHLRLSNGEIQVLEVRPDGRISGRFTALDVDWFSIVLRNDTEVVTGPKSLIEIEPDQHPVIALLQPDRAVDIEVNGTLTLEYEAQDDHGISRVDLVVRGNDKSEFRRTIATPAPGATSLKERHRWDPGAVPVGEDVQFELELQIFDDDTIRGPKVGTSRSLVVRIATPVSRHLELLRKQGTLLDQLVDLLAVRLSQREENISEMAFVTLRSQTEDALAGMARLIVEMEDAPTISNGVRDSWAQIREDLSNQLLHESRLMRSANTNRRKISGVRRVTVRLLENAVVRADDLILDQQFAALANSGERLELERAHLAEQFKRFGTQRSDRARRAILDTLERMENQISRLQSKLEEIRGQVSYRHIQTPMSGSSDLRTSLEKIREALADDNVELAAALTGKLERAVASLMAGLESGHLSFRTDRFGVEDQFVEDLIDRITALETDQIQLRRETLALERRYKEKMVSLMQKKIDSLVQRQLEQTRKMKEILSKRPGGDSGMSASDLAALGQMLQDLELSIGQGDLDQARLMSDEIAAIGDDHTGEEDSPLAPLFDLNQELSKEIAAAFPRPGQIFTAPDKRAAVIQATRQRHLFSRTRKLSNWLAEQEGDIRFLSHQSRQILAEVQDDMTSGVAHLENKEIRQALETQTTALDKLAQLRQDLRSGIDMPLMESRPMHPDSSVVIPAPDDFKVPSRYRKEIIDAMRSGMPDAYREAIRRYYETLVH